MDQRVAVDAFKGAGRVERRVLLHAEQPGGLDHEKWTQALAATKGRIAHGVAEFGRARRGCLVSAKKLAEPLLDSARDPFKLCGEGHVGHRDKGGGLSPQTPSVVSFQVRP